MMQHFARSLAVLALVFSAAACGDDDGPTGAPANITGTYPLRSVNGDDVPTTILEVPGYKFEILSGSLVLNSNNTFTEQATFRETENGTVTETPLTCSGTYTRNGNGITLNETAAGDDCGGTFTGTISGTTVTVSYDAQFQAVYRK